MAFYGIPLGFDNFVGSDSGVAFKKIREAGLIILSKEDEVEDDVEAENFRKKVSKARKQLREKPKGNPNPKKRLSVSSGYERDPEILAAAETRAKGICELCGNQAPFNRADNTPFLEVHHIVFLSVGGPDVLENVAALCPNCHRACHNGHDATKLKFELMQKFTH